MKKLTSYFIALIISLTSNVFAEETNGQNLANQFRDTALLKQIYTTSESSTHITQGGCTDGENIYFIQGLDWNNPYQKCKFHKYNIANNTDQFKVVDGTNLGHANDITYCHDDGYLYVCTNHDGEISVYDKDMNFIRKFTPLYQDGKIIYSYSISYDPIKKQFILGVSRTYDFVILDYNWNFISYMKVKDFNEYTKQGVEIDKDFLYRLLYREDCVEILYGYEKIKEIKIENVSEPEAICTDRKGNFYMITDNNHYKGSTIYKMVLKKDETLE